MPGGNTTTQQQQTSQQSAPWAPTQPLLNGIINTLGNTSTSVTPQQTAGAGRLYDEASRLPNFSPAASDVAGGMLGYNNGGQASLLNNGNQSYQGILSSYLKPDYLNPMTTPGFSDALKTMNSDITNQVNDQFAAAGRDLSPANSTALARGLSQGEGGLLANQFNQNVATQLGAAGSSFGANTGTASGLSSLDQVRAALQSGGLGAAAAIPGLATAPGTAQLGAATTMAGLPFNNLGWLEQSLLPISALGGQSNGTSNGTTTQKTNPLSNIIGGTLGGLGLLGNPAISAGLGAAGSAASNALGALLLPSMAFV